MEELREQANLQILFFYSGKSCIYFFDEIKINEVSFSTKKNIEIKIPFSELESIIGKKVCYFELIRKKKEGFEEIKTSGTFQIYPGNNIAYCYIDRIGVTLELIFLDDNKTMDVFTNKKIEIFANELDPNDRKKIILNKFDSENRANLLLINCNKNLIVEINNNIRISVYELISSVNLYSNSDGYQFSLSLTDLKKYIINGM